MARIKTVRLRRKRQGRTDYRKRIALLKSGKMRLVVRKSLSSITAQVVEYSPKGDKIALSANSRELEKYGYRYGKGNITAAYLTGLLIGKRCIDKGIKEAILDIGLNLSTKGSKLYAAAKGAIDAGLKLPCSEDVFPSEDRIKGLHISRYAESLKKDGERYKRQFSVCLKGNNPPERINDSFEDVKGRIIKK